jgi:hypothetical protein
VPRIDHIDLYSHSVFINCPFSPEYKRIFKAILFAVFHCGFRPRCALEESDATENRLLRIERIIQECRLGIHDISFMEMDVTTGLARFNMPFEFGMFLAAKHFGSGRQREKMALVVDRHPYRYRAALSDISGQDIASHNGVARHAIRVVRDWLDTNRRNRRSLPGGNHIYNRYLQFSRQLPGASRADNLDVGDLTYADLCRAISAWLADNA